MLLLFPEVGNNDDNSQQDKYDFCHLPDSTDNKWNTTVGQKERQNNNCQNEQERIRFLHGRFFCKRTLAVKLNVTRDTLYAPSSARDSSLGFALTLSLKLPQSHKRRDAE
jgi:hypothetical protein